MNITEFKAAVDAALAEAGIDDIDQIKASGGNCDELIDVSAHKFEDGKRVLYLEFDIDPYYDCED